MTPRAAAAPVGQLRPVPRRVTANPKVGLGLALLALFALLALAHPVLMATVWRAREAVYLPETGYDREVLHPSGPSSAHLLGTDSLGRDVVSLLTFAARPTLVVAVVVAATVGVVAVAAGAVAAYWRGPVDGFVTHVADALVLIPPPIAMVVVGVGRPDFGPGELGLLYGLLYGLGPAALVVRSHALTVMAKPFVDAARAGGGGSWWIIRAHVIPHLLPLAAVQMMAGVTGAVVTEGFVEFLGAAETRVGFGSLVYSALAYQTMLLTGVAWSVLLTGSLAISLLCAAFYLLSVGFREELDPREALGT
ncbi:MAG: ABC transporter permease [Acidimicrobiia bacterium]